MEGYDRATYGDRFADVYDDWYSDISDVEATVDGVAALADGGRVLELGCGTGRLLLPLLARGVDVVGLDASRSMLDRMEVNRRAAEMTAPAVGVLGDMADFNLLSDTDSPSNGPFAVVFAAFNTFFNLTTEDDQRSCLACAARHLVPGGHLVLECFLPSDEPADRSDVIDVARMTTDHVVLRITRRDPSDQSVTGQLIDISDDGGVTLRPWKLRYADPAQLDEMARAVGLELVDRSGGWRGEPMTAETIAPVSRYRRAL